MTIKVYLLIIIAIIMVVLGMVLFFTVAGLIASNELLRQLKILKPGDHLELVMEQLGPKVVETSDIKVMEHWGSIKDTSFIQDKKWFKFYSSVPPGRAIEVYTDTNNVILFVTWQPL